MQAVAHGWEPPGKKPIPVKVAKDFVAADKATGAFSSGKKKK